MTTGDVGNLRVRLSLDNAQFERSIASMNRTLQAMGQEIRGLQNRGREWGSSIDGLRQKQEAYSRLLEGQQTKVRRLSQEYEKAKQQYGENSVQAERLAVQLNRASAEMDRTQRELNETTAELQRLERELAQSQTAWGKFGAAATAASEKLKAVGDKMTSIGKDLSMKISAPLTALGAGAAKAAIDFESAFAGVRKTVDTSEEGFAKLEKGIRDMAKELPASASDIASVAESAGQLGIAEDKILSFSRTIIDLGESTNMTREQAATEFARFANIVGMSQDNFDRLGSSIVGLGNTMATTEAEIMSMGMRLAAQGAQVGMSEAQIMALAGTMSSLGIQAEMGGTAMTTVLKKIDKSVGLGGASLASFADAAGVTSKEFKKIWENDAISGLDLLIKGLAKTSAEGGNLSEALRDLGIKGIYESDVMMRMAGASDLLSSAVATSTDAWKENTALTNEAEQRYATTASQLAMLKNKVTEVGITFGQILIPMLISVVDKITPMVEKFSEFDESTRKMIIVIGGFVAAIGPVLIVIGTLISSVGTIVGAIGALSLAIAEAGGLAAFLATKFAFLGTVFAALTSPIGLTVAALVTAAVLIIKYWDPISDFFTTLGTKMVPVFNNITSAVTVFGSKMSEVPSMMMSAWSGAIGTVTGLLASLKEKLSIVTDVVNMSNAMSALKIALESIASVLLMLLGPWGLLISLFLKLYNHTTLLQDVFAMLRGEMSFDEVASNFSTSISDIINNIAELATRLIPLGAEMVVNLINGISNNIGNLSTAFAEVLPIIINTLVMIIPQIILLAADIITNLANGITTNLPLMVNAITSLIELITTTISTLIPQLVEVGVSILSTLIEGIVTALPVIIEVVVQLIDTLISTLTATLPLLIDSGLLIIQTLLDGILIALPLIIESALNIVLSLVEGITTALPAVIEVGLSVITTLLEGIVGALPTIVEAALTIIIALVGALILLLPKIIEAGIQIIVALVDGLIKAIPAIIEAALTLIVSLVEAIIKLLPQLIDAGIKIVEALVEGLIQIIPQLIEAGITLITELLKAILKLLPQLLSAGAELITALVKGVLSILGQLLTAGGKLILGLLGKILGFTGQLLSAGGTLIGKLVSGILSILGDVVGAGAKLITGLIDKILSFTKKLLSAGKDLVISLKNGVVEKTNDMINVGKDLVSGLIKGITGMASDAIDAITGVVDGVVNKAKNLLGIKSPSRVFAQIGQWTSEGWAIGIEEKGSMVKNAVSDIALTAQDIAEHYLNEEKKLRSGANTEIAKIEKNKATEIAKIEKRMHEDVAKAQRAAASKKKKTTQDDALKIQRIKEDAAAKILKLETSSDEKIKSLKSKSTKEIVELETKMNKDLLEETKRYIDDKKSLDQLSLIEEAQIWEQSMKLFAEGTKERVKAQQEYRKATEAVSKEITAINTDFQNQIQKINDDLVKQEETLTKAYEDAVDKRASSLVSFKSLFDAFKVEIDVTGEQLIANLHSQVDGFKLWQSEIEKISGRAIDKGLIEELRQMGPNALPQLVALNQLTDSQLKQYSNLYKEKSKLARTQAETELKGMKDDLDKRIPELRKAANDQLETLKNEWNEKIKSLTKSTSTELSSLEQIGKDAGNGLLQGLSSTASSIQKKAQEIADSVSKTISKALQIKSPSRVMKGFGVNIGEGLVIGMDDMLSKVSNAASRLSSSVEGSMSFTADTNSLNRATSVTTNNTNNTPINITLHYNGAGSERDAFNIVDIVEKELGSRFKNNLRLQGSKG